MGRRRRRVPQRRSGSGRGGNAGRESCASMLRLCSGLARASVNNQFDHRTPRFSQKRAPPRPIGDRSPRGLPSQPPRALPPGHPTSRKGRGAAGPPREFRSPARKNAWRPHQYSCKLGAKRAPICGGARERGLRGVGSRVVGERRSQYGSANQTGGHRAGPPTRSVGHRTTLPVPGSEVRTPVRA